MGNFEKAITLKKLIVHSLVMEGKNQ